MRGFYIIVSFFCMLQSCSVVEECVGSTGSMIEREIEVTPFDKIFIHEGVSAVITQGEDYKVVVKTGSNLMTEISVEVQNNTLIVKDKTECNWTRPYGQTLVYITAPQLEEINSKTSLKIASNGVLQFSYLRLVSLDLTGGAGTGDFDLQIENDAVVIESNNIASFYLSGHTKEFLLNFYYGDGKFKGENFICDTINVFHRGTNDIELYPKDKIEGTIYSTGNILLKNIPAIINVNEVYRGKLVYE
jgi:hypothetical protein